ncbi:GLPGLI family protein [Mucilaginibacter terrae]|uniref:GLPGLI family protein n=1 Tax=Mucilaginibacter terrae TaxID=1955052 RepID=UPI0036294959
MTPKPYFTILLLLITAFAKAQQADTAQAIVHYKFTHVRDTLNKDKPLNENMMLLIGRNASWYKSYDRKQRDDQMRKNLMAQLSSGTGNINMPPAGAPLGPNVEYFQFPNEKKFFSKERMFNNYIVEEAMPVLNWKISADTATFKGLQCQKATTRFKGRDYTAWFCADLPYRAGPWKLNGLPGLIVEAYDSKKEVVFAFDGLEKVDPNQVPAPANNAPTGMGGRTIVMSSSSDNGSQDPNLIALPKNGIKTTAKELAELKKIAEKDPQAFAQSQMAAMQAQMGGSVRFSGGGGAGGAGSPTVTMRQVSPTAQTVINNPIELPEKK